MSIKPILFNTEMVRAILDGRKTVTRRVVKDIPSDAKCSFVCDDYATFRWKAKAKNVNFVFDKEKDVKPPYGPGDILYVRETWFQFKHGGYAYRADSNEVSEMMREDLGYKWRPSIHMPREAARIFLRVTDVRVERLQEMTAEDAHKEGVREGFSRVSGDEAVGNCVDFSLERFETLWDSTIKPADRERYGWAANPWVWVIEFERCEKPEEDA